MKKLLKTIDKKILKNVGICIERHSSCFAFVLHNILRSIDIFLSL